MNIIGAGFLPCGACRAYVPRKCEHYRAGISVHGARERTRRARLRQNQELADIRALRNQLNIKEEA